MRPWWDSIWLWSGVGIAIGAAIAAVVAIILIVALSRKHRS